MRFNALLWLPVFAAAAHGFPVALDASRSVVEVSVSATVGSFVARLGDFDASVSVASADGPVTGAVFRCAFDSIKTGDAHRDHDMNDWQQTDKFPAVMFTLDGITPAGGGKGVAHGRLRLHGMERPLSFPVSIATAQRDVTIDGNAAIDTREYGLPVIRKFLVLTVDPIVRVHCHLEGRVAGS